MRLLIEMTCIGFRLSLNDFIQWLIASAIGDDAWGPCLRGWL